MTHQVVDHLSNRSGNIADAARIIGRCGTNKRKVFDEIYYGKRRQKSVDYLIEKTGLTQKQILTVGLSLANHGIVKKIKIDGKTVYEKISFYTENKNKIQDYADNKLKRENRGTTGDHSQQVIFRIRPKSVVVPRGAKKQRASRLKVAYLTTNPNPSASIRTDTEVRQVTQAIQRSTNRQFIDIAHYPAAQFSDLLDALNEFQPDVVHFSGHGGAQSVVFDGGSIDAPDSVEIDYSMINRALAATKTPPKLLVLNACDTHLGAEVFLDNVSFVVAMSDSIPDITATVFATQLYSALAAKQPLAKAVEQGKLAVQALGLAESDLPKVLAAIGHNADEEIL
ncbi:CHAT domain-containing protein [Abyssibius alkaniclasticus]|uniref:CHAT domain-containing protein n=1 Tax=Abyssibius alkaniclasticus TaxID=2881234 RepID=UPI00405A2427